jgi:hypothetical protein
MVEQVKPFGQAVVQYINTTRIMIDGLSAPRHFSYPRQGGKTTNFSFCKKCMIVISKETGQPG